LPLWLGLLLLVIAVASRPIEVRLWRANRISDRALVILLLGRLPVIVAIAAAAAQAPAILGLLVVGASLIAPVLFYRFTLQLVRDQSVALERGKNA
jgi:hypothetical protein